MNVIVSVIPEENDIVRANNSDYNIKSVTHIKYCRSTECHHVEFKYGKKIGELTFNIHIEVEDQEDFIILSKLKYDDKIYTIDSGSSKKYSYKIYGTSVDMEKNIVILHCSDYIKVIDSRICPTKIKRPPIDIAKLLGNELDRSDFFDI